MKLRKFLFKMFCLVGLSACVPKPITTDYGKYPNNYVGIVREFYDRAEQPKPIKFVKVHSPKRYEQRTTDTGFVVPIDLRLWATVRAGQAMKGYVVCVAKKHPNEPYSVDALFIHDDKVISWIYKTRDAHTYYQFNACHKEDNELLGWLTETETKANNRFIDNFIKSLHKSEKAKIK